MQHYIHLMDGTSVEASCLVEGNYKVALEDLIADAFGRHFGSGYRIEMLSKFESHNIANSIVLRVVVLDQELDYKKKWSDEDIEEAGINEATFSHHIFQGNSYVAVIDLYGEYVDLQADLAKAVKYSDIDGDGVRDALNTLRDFCRENWDLGESEIMDSVEECLSCRKDVEAYINDEGITDIRMIEVEAA